MIHLFLVFAFLHMVKNNSYFKKYFKLLVKGNMNFVNLNLKKIKKI